MDVMHFMTLFALNGNIFIIWCQINLQTTDVSVKSTRRNQSYFVGIILNNVVSGYDDFFYDESLNHHETDLTR